MVSPPRGIAVDSCFRNSLYFVDTQDVACDELYGECSEHTGLEFVR